MQNWNRQKPYHQPWVGRIRKKEKKLRRANGFRRKQEQGWNCLFVAGFEILRSFSPIQLSSINIFSQETNEKYRKIIIIIIRIGDLGWEEEGGRADDEGRGANLLPRRARRSSSVSPSNSFTISSFLSLADGYGACLILPSQLKRRRLTDCLLFRSLI